MKKKIIYIYSHQGYGEDIYMAPVSHYYVKCLGQRLVQMACLKGNEH